MRLWHSILIAYLLVPPWSGPPAASRPDPRIPFTLEPVVLFPREPARRTLGALTFIRGYRLVSKDPEFGGFSALATDGRAFLLLNDGGQGVRFELGADGVARHRQAFELPDGPRRGWQKSDRDSESLTIDPVTGVLWTGFETTNEIWRYAPGFSRAEARAAPPLMAGWPENRGAEAMTRLRDGRFVVIGESEPWPGRPGVGALMFAGDPTRMPRRAFRFSYIPPEGFLPTDVAELPDGRWIAISRHAGLRTGFTACVTIIDPRGVKPGAVVRGREIARFEAPALHDNFEGIAVVRRGDATYVWLVSDDNQLRPWQQSLLLEFRLDERPRRPARTDARQAAG